jgi:hypothetical protein
MMIIRGQEPTMEIIFIISWGEKLIVRPEGAYASISLPPHVFSLGG